LPTSDHPEGEKLVKKYTPINPCSQTVLFFLIRKKLTFWSRFIDQTLTQTSLMEVNILHFYKLKTKEINSQYKALSGDLTIKVEDKFQ
jgi:hypothetical protein